MIPSYRPNYDNQSLYRYTSITGRFMDAYVHRVIAPHPLDQRRLILETKYHKRPDNFAYDFYGDSDLFWVIGVRNGLQDLVFDFVQGGIYIIPAPSYVQELTQ